MKKILLGLLIIVGIYTITGCDKSNEVKGTKSKNKKFHR